MFDFDLIKGSELIEYIIELCFDIIKFCIGISLYLCDSIEYIRVIGLGLC